MKEMNREMELNMNELEQVNGGWTFCIGWGFSNGVEAAACAVPGASATPCVYGSSDTDDHYGGGASACAIIFGAGIGFTY